MMISTLIITYLLFGSLAFMAILFEHKWLERLSLFFALSGLTMHLYEILKRGFVAGRLPFTNTYETLLLLSLLIVAIFFLSLRRFRSNLIAGFVGVLAALVLALSCLLSPEIEPLLPSLKSNWLVFHVSSAFIGYASFALGSASSAVYLLIHAKAPIFSKLSTGPDRDTKLRYLHWLAYRFISLGFPFLTLGIATGAVWANATWGRYWNWDAKETWAFISWVTYGICLHLYRMPSFDCRKTAWAAIFGFATVLFTYFGVNFWFSSLHAYA